MADDLYRYLWQLAQDRATLRLLNVYKGLPISYNAQVLSVDDTGIRVHSNRQQVTCLYYQHETYLQGEALPFIVRSQVTSLHLGKEDATLTNLQIASESIGNRTQIRVEPDESLLAQVQFNGSSAQILADVEDISSEGAAVQLEPYQFSARFCQPGSQVSVSIALPDTIGQKARKLTTKSLPDRMTGPLGADRLRGQPGTVLISTTGNVTSVRRMLSKNRYRVGMRLFFKDLSRAVIMQYIAQRQSEIIRDLSLLSDELYSFKK